MENKLLELFDCTKKAFEYAEMLFNKIPIADDELYEEVECKVHNCKVYMVNEFNNKASQIKSGIYVSSENCVELEELLANYRNVVSRLCTGIAKNSLILVERIATTVHGLLDDLHFTLELRGFILEKGC